MKRNDSPVRQARRALREWGDWRANYDATPIYPRTGYASFLSPSGGRGSGGNRPTGIRRIPGRSDTTRRIEETVREWEGIGGELRSSAQVLTWKYAARARDHQIAKALGVTQKKEREITRRSIKKVAHAIGLQDRLLDKQRR